MQLKSVTGIQFSQAGCTHSCTWRSALVASMLALPPYTNRVTHLLLLKKPETENRFCLLLSGDRENKVTQLLILKPSCLYLLCPLPSKWPVPFSHHPGYLRHLHEWASKLFLYKLNLYSKKKTWQDRMYCESVYIQLMYIYYLLLQGILKINL